VNLFALHISIFYRARFIVTIYREQDISVGFVQIGVAYAISIAIESSKVVRIIYLINGLGGERDQVEATGLCISPGAFGGQQRLACRLCAEA
jgi:hypothetical protein